MFNIEKDIPMPKKLYGKGKELIYPFLQMEIGESFLVPQKKAKSVTQTAYYFTKKTGKKFATRKVEGGKRVWRLE